MEHYLREAIISRESRRSYLRLPLRKQDSDRIRALISRYNSEAKLKFRLVEIDEELFRAYRHGFSLFKNVVNYIALIGSVDDQDMEDKIGYYGELLVLEATAIELATCWITKSFNKQLCESRLELGAKDKLVGVIAIGYPKPKKSIFEKVVQYCRRLLDSKGKSFLKETDPVLPEWVDSGINAVMRAPSRPAKPHVEFEITPAGKIKALALRENRHIELGIAMVHFEIGAAIGRWYKEEGVWTYAVTQLT